MDRQRPRSTPKAEPLHGRLAKSFGRVISRINLFRSTPPAPPRAPVVRRMHELEVLTARLIRSGFAGQYHAAFHGRGVEFSQVREYQPGDDIRTIDWNVTARTSVPHVKEFVEERDLAIVLAIDVSRSMNFGSVDRRKIDLAVELTAVLAFAALQNGDRVGLLVFDDEVRRFMPPGRGRKHVQALVHSAIVAGRETRGRTGIGRAAEFIASGLTKRAVIVFLSDFLDFDMDRSFQRLGMRHDLIVMRVGDPREMRLPHSGIIRLTDAETGSTSAVDLASPDKTHSISAWRRRLDPFLLSSRADVVEISTAIPYDKALLRFFESRTGRRK